ncbi:phosphohydrolase [Deltaproteobacteria bacterium]|nr:phosphohydrolase [Deltaproteobacteria bacterium]
MMQSSDIYKIFPEINQIEDTDLRGKVCSIWLQVCNDGGWNSNNMNKCPIVLENKSCPGNNLEHIHDVAALVLLNYDYMKKKYGDIIQVKRDHLLAAALLHDVGKYSEYTLTPDGPAYSPSGKHLRHPLKGAILAGVYGLPQEVIHAIATHSFEGDHAHATAEYYFLRSSDKMAFESLNYQHAH